MEKTPSKKLNLNNLSTGCNPCLKASKRIERKIGDRKVSAMRFEEIKKIVSSFFDDKNSKF